MLRDLLWIAAAAGVCAAAPAISGINPNTIPVNSPATNIRILGSGLLGTSAAPCSSPAQTVTWASTTISSFGATATEIDAIVPASLLTTVGAFTVSVSVNQINGSACQSLTASATVQVTGPPMLSISTHNVNFTAPAGLLPAGQSVGISTNAGTLAYAVNVQYTSAAPANWIALSSTGGSVTPTSPGLVTISVMNSALNFVPGKYTANVNFSSSTPTQTVAVALLVESLSIPSVMVFAAVAGEPAPSGPQDSQPLVVGAISGPGSFAYTIQQGNSGVAPPRACFAQVTYSSPTTSPWLMVNGSTAPGSGMTGQMLTVSVQSAGLGSGTYVSYIELIAAGSVAVNPITVYLVVENSIATFNFSYISGGSLPAAQVLQATNNCAASALDVTVGASSDQNWLSVVSNQSRGGVSVNMTADPPASMLPGTYYGAVAITDADGDATVYLCRLTVTVAGSGPRLALPHFASQSTWTTGIFVINIGPAPARFAIAFYDDNGTPIPLPFSTGATNNLSGTVPAQGSSYYEAGDPSGSLIAGWGQITADPNIRIQAVFRNQSGTTYYEAAVPAAAGTNEFQIPFDFTIFAATGDRFYTGFAIANLDPVNSAAVNCAARDSNGSVIPGIFTGGSGPLTLAPLGHYANYLFPSLFGMRGTIDCYSTTTIAATALRVIGANALSSLPVINNTGPPLTGTQSSALPHFAAQDTWTTGIFVLNTGSQAANFAISFYDDNGNPISVPFAGGPTSNLSGTVPARGEAYYEASDSSSPLIFGSGQITADPSIVVQAVFRNNADGTYYEAAVPANAGSKEFEIPFDATVFAANGAQFYTGFAIANLDPLHSASITCAARTSSGSVIPNAFTSATGPSTLLPSGHWDGYLFQALYGMRGTIDCTSNATIAATALRFIGSDAFSSLPVINK